MAKMELTEEQWQKLGQHLPQDGDFLFSLLPNSDYMLNAVRHGVVLNSRMLVYLLLTERDSLVFTLIAAAEKHTDGVYFAGFLDYRADSEVGTFGDFGPYFYRDVGLDEILSVAFAGLFGNDQGEGHYSFDFSSCGSSHGCFCGCCTQILLVQIFFTHNCKFFMS